MTCCAATPAPAKSTDADVSTHGMPAAKRAIGAAGQLLPVGAKHGEITTGSDGNVFICRVHGRQLIRCRPSRGSWLPVVGGKWPVGRSCNGHRVKRMSIAYLLPTADYSHGSVHLY